MSLINFKNIKPKQRIFYWLISFFAFVVLISYLVVKPAIFEIKKLRLEIITEKRNTIESIYQERNSDKITADLEKVEPQIEKLDQIFINYNRELEFITFLEDIAEKNKVNQNISFNSPEVQKSQKQTFYKEAPSSINLQGRMLNIMNYITSLEKSSYYINISKIDLSSKNKVKSFVQEIDKKNGPGSGSLTASIQATTYWR